MSLLDKASLIVTPNSYKASKLYSVIPSSGAGDMDVVRATTATRVNASGLIESVGLNIPRIDYTNGSCPSLLVEPQRTNLALYSEQFDNAIWVKQLSTISANATTSPSGIVNADKYIPTNANGFHPVNQSISVTNGASYSFSIYAKAAGYNFLLINTSAGSASGNVGPLFDLSNGTLIGSLGGNNYNAKIKAVGDNWYRIDFSYITSGILTLVDINAFPTSAIASYAGNGTSGVYLWGAQLELGAYATSYIPTVASTVTRNADVISKTGISSLIGQTEGTLFCDVNLNSRANFTYFAIAPNIVSTSTYIGIFVTSSIIGFEIIISGVVQVGINFSNSSTGRFKIAAAYKNNDFAFYINGNLIGIDTLGNIPACSDLGLNAFSQAQTLNYNSVQLYKTRLTNTELQSLTTL